LRRDPDPDSVGRLQRGEVSRARLLRELFESREFERVELFDDGLALALAERLGAERGRPRGLRAPAWSEERAIEIPWCLARYDGEQRVLDVGTAFAEPAYIAGLGALGASELVTVDLAEPADVIADIRKLPFADDSFDLAYCISTLEHVGRDNAVYDIDAPRDDHGDEAALRQLRRVARRVIVTVPVGVHDDQGWQIIRPAHEWIELFERSAFLVYEDELYVRTDDGWRTATVAEADAALYREDGAGAVLLAELRPAGLSERARLAVRDVKHRDTPRRSTLSA
ncbi:MAG TPA: methyltransferase domain-containing protein, partial [Gaiellaceae bacterium]|nr:methyltransferase domain-containing protein [Gaiellaceae bacterium]